MLERLLWSFDKAPEFSAALDVEEGQDSNQCGDDDGDDSGRVVECLIIKVEELDDSSNGSSHRKHTEPQDSIVQQIFSLGAGSLDDFIFFVHMETIELFL